MKREKAITANEDLTFCKEQIELMLVRSQTKVIFPTITLGLVKEFVSSRKELFNDSEIRHVYEATVQQMKEFLGHDMHIGGKYYDAYPSRNLPKYGVLAVVKDRTYRLERRYRTSAEELTKYIPERIKKHIDARLDIIPELVKRGFRVQLSESAQRFGKLFEEHIDRSPANFEIFSFAIIKVHLEKFACKVYRDTRTATHDSGVDISTNFGVVYQIKKMKVVNQKVADDVYAELRASFDRERLDDGKVILIIDDISESVRKYLIDMKVQSIRKQDLIRLAAQMEDTEDREKVLRVIYEEFRRDYASDVGRRGQKSY